MEIELPENFSHQDILEILPWYANGTLGESLEIGVAKHIRNCIVCRRELAVEQRTINAFRTANPAEQSAHASYERLQARIAGGSKPTRIHPGRAAARIAAWLEALGNSASGWKTRWALIAMPAAVIALAFGVENLVPGKQGQVEDYPPADMHRAIDSYHTLSTTKDPVMDSDDIHVIFAAGMDAEAIESLLDTFKGEVIFGPNSAGAYTVRLLDVSSSKQRLAIITALRKHEKVLFAEAAQPTAVPRLQGGISK